MLVLHFWLEKWVRDNGLRELLIGIFGLQQVADL